MFFALCFLIAVSAKVGETYEDQAVVEGIGTIALPPGKWLFEHSKSFDRNTNNPEVFVFKKLGDRLERLTFQRFGSHIAHPISAYFDSIGDSTSHGVPRQLFEFKDDYDAIHILRPIFEMEQSGSKVTCMGGSFLYSSESGNHWMSHAFVSDRNGWVLVCVHASPFAILPETVETVFADSTFETGQSKKEGRTKP
ncbi:MAG: hypothetical protein JNL58_01035 [Planctomyces sp.]|nr:hypothetical protein [Planctomyces sp.]